MRLELRSSVLLEVVKRAERWCEFGGYHAFEGCMPNARVSRYPHPKSLPAGKGLTLAIAGSISGVSQVRNLSKF